MKIIGKSAPAAGSQKSPPQRLERWLDEHHEAILRRWLKEPSSLSLTDQLVKTAHLESAADGASLHRALLRALADPTVAGQLLDVSLLRGKDTTLPPGASALSPATWHALLQDMRQSIIAELQATTPPDQILELLLAADDALNGMAARLVRSSQQQLGQLTRERGRFQALFTVTHEIATSLDLDRVAQSALNGVLKTTGADVGVLLILDRESGRLFPWASLGWDVAPVEPDLLPEDWTQGWRNTPISPIGNVATLPEAGWQTALQMPSTVAA